MDLLNDTVVRYRSLYGSDPEIIATAPGRVNLIGEHTDYNDGCVLPIAIDRSMIVACGRRPDNILALYSVDLQSSYTVPISSPEFNSKLLWSNYPAGVASVFQTEGFSLPGMNVCIRGTVPIGAGLSSSAALEVACVVAFSALNDIALPPKRMITMARTAETKFVGVQCGVMDQFVSMMGRKGHALFLDCRSMEHRDVPFPASARLVIGDTGVRRELARTAYNQREAECDDAARQIGSRWPSVKSLRDVALDDLHSIEARLSTVFRRRVHHVVTENHRVFDTVDAMEKGDLSRMGNLMTDSHKSLRDYFEVSCKELDAFVEVANGTPGVYGSRMTGAGFGGSGISIVAVSSLDALVDRLRIEYPRFAGRSLTVYLASPDDGAAVYHLKEGFMNKHLIRST